MTFFILFAFSNQHPKIYHFLGFPALAVAKETAIPYV
jgi:hypothetical protein